MQRFKKILFSNYKAKVVCVLVAVLLWVFVASSQSLLGKFPNQIPIKVVNLSDQYQAFLDQDNVQIYTMAEPSVWRTLTTDSFVASVDLAGKTEGTYELDVKVVSNVADVQVTKVDPAKVFVSVEKIVSKTVTLSPKVDGDPADGMVVGQIDLSPETVEVRGAKSYIDSISEANASIKLNGESSSFERDAKVIAVAEDNSQLSNVTFNPATVLAKVTIAKGGNNKTVGVRVKTSGSPKDGYFVSKVVSTPALVDITGQRSTLNNIDYLETEPIDVTGQSATISKEVNLTLPSGVLLQKGTSQRVKIEISFDSYGTSKTVSPLVQAVGLPEGLRITSYSPSDIKVSLSGPKELLDALSPSEIVLSLNLSGKSAGNYSINIDKSMVTAPANINVSGIDPAALSIIIGN